MSSKINKRFPKVLADKLSFAFFLCDQAGINRDDWDALLSMYRRKKVKYIASVGITFGKKELPSPDPDGFEILPVNVLRAIAGLDDAFQALHQLRDGEEDDYISDHVAKRVASLKNSELGSRPRSAKLTDKEINIIASYLDSRDLKNSDNKKAIYSDAMEVFRGYGSDDPIKRLTKHQLDKAIKKYKEQF